MLYGQELLNHINSQIDKYTELGNWNMVDNYKAKKIVLENKGFSQYGIVNHIDKTITKEVVWITEKPMNAFNGTYSNNQGIREFNSNINYWTGEQEEVLESQLQVLEDKRTIAEKQLKDHCYNELKRTGLLSNDIKDMFVKSLKNAAIQSKLIDLLLKF